MNPPFGPSPPAPSAEHPERPEVLVVGAGPAGLSLARRVAAAGARVTVVDRDDEPGGIPRHCDHPGFGLRDLHRPLRGPAYARRLADLAVGAGASILTATTVTGWSWPAPGGRLGATVTSRSGVTVIEPQVVVLATGCRERPRAARLIAGDRPAGVFTTGSLQRTWELEHRSPGSVAVVVGEGLVALSAVMTLRRAGTRVVGLVARTVPAAVARALRVPLRRAGVSSVRGAARVSGIELDDGSTVACDTVVFSGEWVPDHDLARLLGLALSPGWRGPATDTDGRTDRPGVFAVGNLVHGALAADACARRATGAAGAVLAALAHPDGPSGGPPAGPAVIPGPGVAWVHPGRIGGHRGDLLVRPGDGRSPARRLLEPSPGDVPRVLEVVQGGRMLATVRTAGVAGFPRELVRIPARRLAGLDPGAGPVEVHGRS